MNDLENFGLNEQETAKLLEAIRDCSEETRKEIAEKLQSL